MFSFFKALHALGSFEESKQSLKKARRIKPTDQDINKALKDLEKWDILTTSCIVV